MKSLSIFLLCLFLLPSAYAEYIWLEGENAQSSNARQHGWYNSVKTDQLSGGKWLNHFSNAGPAEATWNFSPESAGKYTLWVRANPVGAKLSWSLNGGPWNQIDFSSSSDQINIARDGGIDIRFVAWVNAGTVDLPDGQSRISFRMESKNQNHGGIDCFVFSQDGFAPDGKLKPGQKLGLADEGSWAFEPGRDPLSNEVALDLSTLNEDTAGMNGFVKANEKGDFIDGAGKDLRFWAVNTGYHYQTRDIDELRYHAKWLARRGVNMVRSHSHLLSKSKNAKITDVDADQVDRIKKLVAAMRDEGIYTTISPYWAVAVSYRNSLGIPNPDGKNLTGMLFWDEKLQEGYKAWWRELLTTPNPYSGVRLVDDPAVAMLQLQNEDSLLFYTLRSVQGEARRDLRKRFHNFLVNKYGSIEKAFASWDGNITHENDRLDSEETGLFSIWHLTQPAKGARANRYADQLEFYGRTMFEFNQKMADFLRNELGCKHLINAGNWHTASAEKMYDIERWSYTANEVIGANRYFNGGKHINPSDRSKSGYLISKGDRFTCRSVLTQPRRFPLAVKMPKGHPFIISESSWVSPLEFQSEGPLLVSAYSSLTGFDTFYWFSMGESDWSKPIGKWSMNTPMILGQFPAASLLFRKQYINQGTPVLEEHRTLEDLWNRRKPLAVEDAGYDPNRDTGTFNELSSIKTSMDPLAYLAGPVLAQYDSNPSYSRMEKPTIENGVVTSNTGELKWDTENGLFTLNNAKVQGVSGFFEGTKIELDDVSFATGNEYITATMVSVDGEDLKESKKILLQIGTTTRPYGWKTRQSGEEQEILSLGSAPWNVKKANIKVEINNPKIKRALVLDANFLERESIAIDGGVFSVPEDALYVVLVGE